MYDSTSVVTFFDEEKV